MEIQSLQKLMGNAMALRNDADIWWLGLETHYRTYVVDMFTQMIDKMQPRWIPRKLWDYWHRG